MKIAMNMLLIWVAGMSLAFSVAEGQPSKATAVDCLEQLNRTYLQASSYATEVHLHLYKAEEPTKPAVERNGWVKKQGLHYLIEFGGRTTLANSQCMMLADHGHKTIVFKALEKNQQPPMDVAEQLAKLPGLDEVEGQWLVNSNTEKRFRIVPESGEYSSYELSIDPKNWTLKGMSFQFRTDPSNPFERMEVRYENTQLNQRISKDTFSTKAYVVVRKGEPQLTPQYANYRLVNPKTTLLQLTESPESSKQ